MFTCKANLIIMMKLVQNRITSKKFRIVTGECVEDVRVSHSILIFSFTHSTQSCAFNTSGRTGFEQACGTFMKDNTVLLQGKTLYIPFLSKSFRARSSNGGMYKSLTN